MKKLLFILLASSMCITAYSLPTLSYKATDGGPNGYNSVRYGLFGVFIRCSDPGYAECPEPNRDDFTANGFANPDDGLATWQLAYSHIVAGSYSGSVTIGNSTATWTGTSSYDFEIDVVESP